MKGNIAIIANEVKPIGDFNFSAADLRIMEIMKILRLPAMLEEYRSMVMSDELYGHTVEEIIEKLLEVQLLSRRENAANKRIAKANLWFEDASALNLESEGINVDKSALSSVLRFNFIKAGGVVNIIGGTRNARTYLACAIAREACANRYNTFYIRFPSFVDDQNRAEAERWIYGDAGFLRDVDLLIIDNFVEMEGTICEDARNRFKDLMDYRSRNKGTIFASFVNPDGWASRLTSSRNVSAMMKNWFSKGQTFNLGTGDREASQASC